MSELFSQLGINWMLLLAQIINFAILAYILTRFLYKPVIKMLNERKERVANDLEKSKNLEERIRDIEIAKDEVLASSRREGEKLIKQSEKSAAEIKDTLLKETSNEVARIKEDSKKQIESDRQKTMDELKKELGSLVALSVEKAMGDVLDVNAQKKMVDEAVKKTAK